MIAPAANTAIAAVDSWTSIVVAVTFVCVNRGRCKTNTMPASTSVTRATRSRKIKILHPARNSRSFQKIALAPRMGPSGGPIGGRGGNEPSIVWSRVMDLFRSVFRVAFEACEVLLVASSDSMPRHKPIHGLAEQAGHCIVAAHPHKSFWRRLRHGRASWLQLPAFQPGNSIAVLESPLEHARLLQ